MRKVVLGMNVTLDGYAAGPNGELDWMFPSIDAELNRSILKTLDEIDTFVMGRHTYLGMAAHWPNANDEIASRMNRARKIVFSDTLATVDWEHSTLVRTDPAVEFDRCKRQSGKNIGVAGGARFAQYVSVARPRRRIPTHDPPRHSRGGHAAIRRPTQPHPDRYRNVRHRCGDPHLPTSPAAEALLKRSLQRRRCPDRVPRPRRSGLARSELNALRLAYDQPTPQPRPCDSSRSHERETGGPTAGFTNDRPCRRIPTPDWFCLGLTASKSSGPDVVAAWATIREPGV